MDYIVVIMCLVMSWVETWHLSFKVIHFDIHCSGIVVSTSCLYLCYYACKMEEKKKPSFHVIAHDHRIAGITDQCIDRIAHNRYQFLKLIA